MRVAFSSTNNVGQYTYVSVFLRVYVCVCEIIASIGRRELWKNSISAAEEREREREQYIVTALYDTVAWNHI